MRLSPLPLITCALLIGCNPDQITNELSNSNNVSVSLPAINCSNQTDSNNQIIATDTRVETKAAERNYPLDLTVSVKAEVTNLSKDEIEDAYIILPNGAISGSKWTYSEPSDEFFSPSAVNVYYADFGTYAPQEGIRRIPTNNYCLMIELKNSTYIAKSFDLERPDGNDVDTGEQYIHYADRNSVGGGSYSFAVNSPVVSEIDVINDELVATVTFDDPRIQRVRVSIYNKDDTRIGLAILEDLSLFDLENSKTYTLTIADFKDTGDFSEGFDLNDTHRVSITAGNIGTDRFGNEQRLSEILITKGIYLQ